MYLIYTLLYSFIITNYYNYNTNINKLILQNNNNFLTIIDKKSNNNLLSNIVKNKNYEPTVYIHLSQIIPKTPIYHIGTIFDYEDIELRFDFGLYNLTIAELEYYYEKYIDYFNLNLTSKIIYWDKTNKTIDEVLEYESNLNKNYILCINDCRHYTRDLTDWATGNSTPIWNLYKLILFD